MFASLSFSSLLAFVTRLMSGGTLEIILLIVLIIVGLVLFLLALWILWKLLVLLGKGLLWLIRAGTDLARGRAHTMREARLAAPPPVATGWRSSPRIGLKKALKQAFRLAGPDAHRIVVVAGEGMTDLCRSLGLTPPGIGTVGIAAGDGIVLIGASDAGDRMLRRLARALPWRRPVDGVAAIVESDGIPPEALTRAAGLARTVGMKVAMHFVLPSPARVLAVRIVDSRNRDGDDLCTQLASDTARIWLAGGSREGLNKLALVQSRELPAALDRALAAAPISVLDIASLSFSGEGLRAGVVQTLERTHPASTPGLARWVAIGVFAAGAALAGLAVMDGMSRISVLRAAVENTGWEASSSWTVDEVGTVPDAARVRRIAGLGVRLSEVSDFSPLAPFVPLAPNQDAPRRLGAALLDSYLLRPLAVSLDLNVRERLSPSNDPERWLDDARLVDEWFAAWEGLAVDPREVDLRRLLVDAFGEGGRDSWAEGTDRALVRAKVEPPGPDDGGLQIDRLTDLAQESFVLTMQQWADTVYTNGPVARAARRATDRSSHWQEQHAALVDLRIALQDPSQQWLTATKDKPDHRFEVQVLGRAVGMRLFGSPVAVEAKAAVSEIRIEAREAAEYFILPGIGPLMTRSSTGGQSGGGGQSLVMTPEAMGWLAFLDRVVNSGLSDLPAVSPRPLPGLVTVDPVSVAGARRKLQIFDQFAANLPAGIPPAIAQDLIRSLASELVIGVTISVEQALRIKTRVRLASEEAARSATIVSALDDMAKIEEWLFQRGADYEADKVAMMSARVAEGALMDSLEMLVEEDPMGLYIDPAADRMAMVRRYERGLTRLNQIHDQLAAPFISAALQGSHADATRQWRNMARDMEAYGRGDAASVLSGMEGMLHAWADSTADACAAPRVAMSTRDDYLARALRRLGAQFDNACDELIFLEARKMTEGTLDLFEQQIASFWPYSADENARELSTSTVTEFVTRLLPARTGLEVLDHPLVEHADFWALDDDGHAAVRFRIDWRTRPEEERLAEHLMEHTLLGAESDEAGVSTWRYGAPASIRLRLAKNSRYRFASGGDPDQRVTEKVISKEGNGALIRMFKGLSRGVLMVRTEVVDEDGSLQPLVLTARVTSEDARPMTLPDFSRAGLHIPRQRGGR